MSFRSFLAPLWSRLSTRTTQFRRPTMNTNNALQSLHEQQQQWRGMASKKHKAILREAKGFRGRAKNCFRVAVRRVHKAWQYAYRDRKQQKREWRKLWIQRVGAGFRQYGWSYSKAIHELPKHNIMLNRKVLSELASNEPFAFKAVVDVMEAAKEQKEKASA